MQLKVFFKLWLGAGEQLLWQLLFFLKKMGQSRPLLVNFRPFLITIAIIQIEKSLDGVHGIQTHGRLMVGSDDTTELWRPQQLLFDIG